jgi:hypothetical protein
MCHVCEEDGVKHMIDLQVDGAFPSADPEDLVGKLISVSYLQPFISIGVDVKVED